MEYGQVIVQYMIPYIVIHSQLMIFIRIKLLLFILIKTTTSLSQIDSITIENENYEILLKKINKQFPQISSYDARKKIDDNKTLFLDTRSTKEYNISHIKNAILIEYNKFDLGSMDSISKHNEIIVYCSIGSRSVKIGEKLKKLGYQNVKNLYGGLFNWININFPLVNNKGEKTINIHGYSKEWSKWIINGNIIY